MTSCLSCCSLGCRGILGLSGVTGKSKNLFMSRRTVAFALMRLPLAILLSCLLSLMGLILLMARCANIDAVRRCLELCRRSGVPTIYPWWRPGNENPLQQIIHCNSGVSIFRLAPMLLQLHTPCDTPLSQSPATRRVQCYQHKVRYAAVTV